MSESDPVPGGRPGEVERATALSGELSGQGVHGVVLSYVDTAGIGRVKTVPTAKLASATAWGVGMSPVFDTFLADDTIVATDVQGLAGLLQERVDADELALPDALRIARWAGRDNARRVYRLPGAWWTTAERRGTGHSPGAPPGKQERLKV
ncbi:hypothetical protein GCM10023323_73390 [Streptomyces thinghirensis]|uniref:Glutamine synthetase n=1 Tax=Streptomyces thinghirensis TaxID=551547 RepID=A0ABP9TFR5_9ACTN